LDATDPDLPMIIERLGHRPRGPIRVALRDRAGLPIVLESLPVLFDGTPMPTLFWLVDPELRYRVGRLEAEGGVKRAALALEPERVAEAHRAYAALRETRMPAGFQGIRASGGVAGTREGIKCLHAHYAYHLMGGVDPVGAWVAGQLSEDEGRSRQTFQDFADTSSP
jgi:hypothetical protein